MNFQFGRISLLPETRLHREPVFDVVMIGHTDKQADLASLFANHSMLSDMRDAGYSSQLDQLFKQFSQTDELAIQHHSLYNIPIPLHSFDEFRQLFSVDSDQAAEVRYKSRLGGDYVWLPLAIADFFHTEVMRIARRLWIIAVDENLEINAFLSPDNMRTPAVEEDNAFLRALALPNVGIISMPDFERLHIAQSIKPVPKLRIVNPQPAFLPCNTNTDDGITERSILVKAKTEYVDNFVEHLGRLLNPIKTFRPDINLLLNFPYDKEMDGELPAISSVAENQLKQWMQEGEQKILRHVQLVYPFLQNIQGELSSACGILAGKMLTSTTEKGSWRSIAGTPLNSLKKPFPNLSIKQTGLLRDGLGIGVLHQPHAKLQLDDERLLVPYVESMSATNSGELSRFMGWLIRSLERLGLSLVFESQDAVLRSDIVLRDFFGRLYAMGALRGKRSEDAFSIKSWMDGDACIIEIEIAPALAIDRLILDLRIDNSGVQQLTLRNPELRHGR